MATRQLDQGSTDELVPTSAADLLAQCTRLLFELDQFKEHLVQHRKERTVEFRTFRSRLKAESKALEKLATRQLEEQSTQEQQNEDDHLKRAETAHHVRSSNVPFYKAVWDAAKSSRGIISFNKSFPCAYSHESSGGTDKDIRVSGTAEMENVNKQASSSRDKTKRKKSVVVDIVTQGGKEWVKVSTVTETRLLFEVAENGWPEEESQSEDEGQDNSGEDAANENGHDDDNHGHTSLLRQAQDLQNAADAATVLPGGRPRVRFVLPKLQPGRVQAVDSILDKIRQTGTIVHCRSDLDRSPPPPLDEAMPRMMLDEFADFTSTLNIDCTILLALVSDLSHSSVDIDPSFHVAIRRQIERERTDNVIPSVLWPGMVNRDLVCTAEAARRMREIVDTIGTPTEKARTALLMDGRGHGTLDGTFRDHERPGQDIAGGPFHTQDLLATFQELSCHPIPEGWRIPIQTVPATFSADIDISSLPPIAQTVRARLTSINQSVFLYGWVQGITTLSSNRTVAKMIWETLAEGKHRGGTSTERGDGEDDRNDDGCSRKELFEEGGQVRNDAEVGPHIWLCPTARSLLGKEKSRR